MFQTPNFPPPAVATLRSPQHALNARTIRREHLIYGAALARCAALLAVIAVGALIVGIVVLKALLGLPILMDQACAMRAM